jgi:hypothetical protein
MRAFTRIAVKFFSIPETPLQRLGALGLAAAFAIVFWTALDWQIGESFLRRSVEHVPVQRPEKAAINHRWERDNALPFVWRLVDEQCIARLEQAQRRNAGWTASQERQRIIDCTREERPGFDKVMGYRLNISGYFEALTQFQPYQRAYGSTVATAAMVFVLALLAYLGFMDQLLCWVRTGRLEPRRPAA